MPPQPNRPRSRGFRFGFPKLGDIVEKALGVVGITKERVSEWLGEPCGCVERKEKLNAISAWANRVLLGHTDDAAQYFDQMTASSTTDKEQASGATTTETNDPNQPIPSAPTDGPYGLPDLHKQ